MNYCDIRLSNRDQRLVELILQGCNNVEIAKQLNMALRTVKAHINRLFVRFGVTSGIKRVKLAVILYRRQLYLQASVKEDEHPVSGDAVPPLKSRQLFHYLKTEA